MAATTAHIKRIWVPAASSQGPHEVPLWVVAGSETDARLEALQLTPERQVYWGAVTGGAIELKPGGTVLDIGANVGSFARLAAHAVGPTGTVYAVEPLPDVFDALCENARWATNAPAGSVADDALGLSAGSQPAGIVPIQAAVVESASSRTCKMVEYPRCTALSTLAQYRDDRDALDATLSLVQNNPHAATSPLEKLGRTTSRWLPWVYAPLHRTVAGALLLQGARAVSCPAATLSQLIDHHAIERVDLLKINTERSELGVLRSVAAHHWPCIQQVSMQVHDRGGALDQVCNLLRCTAGFTHVTTYKEPRFAGCCLVQVYASRRVAGSSATGRFD